MAHSTTLQQIIDLEAERAALYARFGERRWLEVSERERLHTIRRELALLWDRRQREKAGAAEGAMPDNVRDEVEFTAPRGARAAYRSRRYGGRTWAAALLELERGG